MINDKFNSYNIGIIVFPLTKAGITPFLNLIDTISSISNNIYNILGNADGISFNEPIKKVNIHNFIIEHKQGKNQFSRITNYVWTQIRICFLLIKISKFAKTWLFFLGGENLILPMLISKIFGKHVVLVLCGCSSEMAKFNNDIYSIILQWIFKINCYLTNKIILYSPNLIKEWNLEKYRHKIFIAHEHFLDFDKFKIEKPVDERDNLVGYVGRLGGEKGILNFLEAIPDVLEARNEVAFLIGGDGQLRPQVEECTGKLDGKVKFVGWIPHDELPRYLNELRLLVIPSYTETGPYIAFEAMACGTPVLGTPVGLMSDMINDGETGFIMENNSPECIAENIIRALNHPNLEQIAQNARELVEREFTFEKAVEGYRKIVNGEE